jgi:hypothetical protein
MHIVSWRRTKRSKLKYLFVNYYSSWRDIAFSIGGSWGTTRKKEKFDSEKYFE